MTAYDPQHKSEERTQDLGLENDFPTPEPGAWRTAAEALLKGDPIETALFTPIDEGFSLHPVYRREDIAELSHIGSLPGMGNRVRGRLASGSRTQPWRISQELPYGTPEEFNAAARYDLARGQDELNIHLDLATRAGEDPDVAAPGRVGACGLSLATLRDMERAFDGIDFRDVSLYFRAGSSGLPVAALLFALARKRRFPSAALRGCIEMDPLASLATKGGISVAVETAFSEMASLTRYAAEHAPNLQTIGVQSHVYHDGGATAVQELAFALATATTYVRRMAEHGIPFETTAPRIRFALSAGPHFFVEIAKFRAARLLWSHVAEAFGGPEESRGMYIHARTSLRNKSALDPATNFLRASGEAFAAVVGGCDSLHVGAYDEVVRVPDAFSRRVARNTHIILRDECGLNRVIDPAGGAGVVESLTDSIGREAWTLFQEIEAAGGMEEALRAGIPQDRIAATADRRREKLARRRELLIGVNAYPNAVETPLEPRPVDYTALHEKRSREIAEFRVGSDSPQHSRVMEQLAILLASDSDGLLANTIEALEGGASLGEIGRTIRPYGETSPSVSAVSQERLARPYEMLREAARVYAREHGHPPRILQANYGASRSYRARADWTASFFQAGGFEVLADRDFETSSEIVAALHECNATITVLVSTDDRYKDATVPLAEEIKHAHPDVHLMLAGDPRDREPEYRSAGVDAFVHLRVNHYEMNRSLLQKIGAL